MDFWSYTDTERVGELESERPRKRKDRDRQTMRQQHNNLFHATNKQSINLCKLTGLDWIPLDENLIHGMLKIFSHENNKQNSITRKKYHVDVATRQAGSM